MPEPTEHPAFTRAKALSEPWRSRFPHTPEEARSWQPWKGYRALHMHVLVAMTTRIECAWAAYIGPVEGVNHDLEFEYVLDHGDKLPEEVARALFPSLDGVPYAY